MKFDQHIIYLYWNDSVTEITIIYYGKSLPNIKCIYKFKLIWAINLYLKKTIYMVNETNKLVPDIFGVSHVYIIFISIYIYIIIL